MTELLAFLNLGSQVRNGDRSARFLFPSVSPRFVIWIIITAPISLSGSLVRVLDRSRARIVLSLTLTVVANEFLNVDPFLKIVTAAAIVFMSLALVGLATGLGARYPRFSADNVTQVAGSPGGVAFMIAAVSYILVMICLLGWPSSLYHGASPASTCGIPLDRSSRFVSAFASHCSQHRGLRFGCPGVKALQDFRRAFRRLSVRQRLP